ncbi:hypothetical protein WJX72_009070 [[Myrmecia] bisecta]|uniref:Uncharacterized protein n=1 Tax=[Myrmecia] bisecta TaxID=41462 RepID=A0AAW1QT40_9CHLO
MASPLKPYQLKLFMSNKYVYAQIVRMLDGHVVAAASTIEKPLRQSEVLPSKSDKQACSHIGKLLAERAKAADVEAVHWARKRQQKFHGKIASLINSMKEAGVQLQ